MLKVLANKKEAGQLSYDSKNREFVFNYTQNNPVLLTMPYQKKSYLSHYHLHPIFDMSMPEGYLFSLFKNLLIKEYGEIDDFILFEHLSRSIEGYLSYEQKHNEANKIQFHLEDVLADKDKNLFSRLVENFLYNSAIAGVQPKVLALLQDKVTLSTKAYIVKSFSEEFPHLAENEYFCMRALNHAGIKTPKFWISESKKLFVMEKFTYQKEKDGFYGFEEFCVLFGFNKEKKYYGSYEKIAKAIYQISTHKHEDLEQFFKMLVMNYLLKNGDAHLKNFGVLYEAGMQTRFLAPAYDVVNTVIYLPKDKPALTMFGKKIWWDKEQLIAFGVQYCFLEEKNARTMFNDCVGAIKKLIDEIEEYITHNREFQPFGEIFLKILHFSLQNFDVAYKELPHGVL